jgi:hypothetical protein
MFYEEGYTDLSERDFWPRAPLKLRACSGGIRIYRLQYPQSGLLSNITIQEEDLI